MTLRRFNNYDLEGMPAVLAWNPIAMRCDRVDEGCRNCWHLRMCDRLANNHSMRVNSFVYKKDGVGIDLPISIIDTELPRKPRIIAVQFMGDLWHTKVPDGFRNTVLHICRRTSQHTYLFLTKRPECVTEDIPANCWLGASVHDQASAEKRIPVLAMSTAANIWVSAEPLLGKIDFNLVGGFDRVRWVACGGETGLGARPFDGAWINEIARVCERTNKRFYDKRALSTDGFTRREYPREWKTDQGNQKT